MGLTPSTLIHFTKSKAALKGILKEGFRIHYCREQVALSTKSGGYAAPMVSFCDIRLSNLKDHIDKYGCYGLGLSKSWGRRSRLNPVLYVARKSNFAASYEKAFLHFLKGELESASDQRKALADVLRYLKNDEADLVRKGKTIKNYRFADEREWRYVPSTDAECVMMLPPSAYDDQKQRAAAEASVKGDRLDFTPNDIKYILLKNDSEISEFVKYLRDVKGDKYTLQDIERLTTRIFTAEQIENDF